MTFGELFDHLAIERGQLIDPWQIAKRLSFRYSLISSSLQRKHMRIFAAQRDELGVRALLDDASVLQDDDALSHAHRRKSMRDDDRHAPV